MSLAVKGSRVITVGGTDYRWRLRRRPSYNQACFETPLTFAVEVAGAGGSVLAVEIPDASHPGSLVGTRSRLIVRPALAADGSPRSPGSPFRLSVASADLPTGVKTEMNLR
jgi:hypothetical protein